MPLSATYTGIGIAPELTTGVALSRSTVRLEFSEAMSSTGLTTAGNYTITPAMGSDARTVTSVTAESSTSIVLVLDGDMTPGTLNYTATAANVTDLAGNEIDPDNDSATFDGPPEQEGAVEPDTVQNDGGYSMVLTWEDVPDGTYHVHVGPLGTDDDPACYSGIIGQGNSIEIVDGAAALISPPLPAGGPYAFTIVLVSDPLTIYSSDTLLTVVPHDFRTATMSLRRLLPVWLRTGPRHPYQEVYPQ